MECNYISGVRLRALPPKGSFLRELPVVRSLAAMDELPFTKPVTFLVGENGTGKSTLLAEIHALVKAGAEVLELSEYGIRSVDYRDTGHYRLTRAFLENPERMLHYLLDE